MSHGGSLRESDWRLGEVENWRASGLSVAEYCRRHDLCASTLYNWRRLAACAAGSAGQPAEPVLFREIGHMEPRWAAEIALKSGVVVRLAADADSRLLRELVEALG
jgi:transposase-like protein